MLALLLATIGLYRVMSCRVASRRTEISVRIALGSTHARIIRLVLGEVGLLVVAGIAIDAPLTLAAAELISAFFMECIRRIPRPWRLQCSSCAWSALAPP